MPFADRFRNKGLIAQMNQQLSSLQGIVPTLGDVQSLSRTPSLNDFLGLQQVNRGSAAQARQQFAAAQAQSRGQAFDAFKTLRLQSQLGVAGLQQQGFNSLFQHDNNAMALQQQRDQSRQGTGFLSQIGQLAGTGIGALLGGPLGASLGGSISGALGLGGNSPNSGNPFGWSSPGSFDILGQKGSVIPDNYFSGRTS